MAGRSVMFRSGSGARTSSPHSSRWRVSHVPTKPWPPVTNARTAPTLRGVPIEGGEAFRAPLPRERRRPGPPALGHGGSTGLVQLEDVGQRLGESIAVADVHEAAGVADDLGNRTGPRGHDGYARGHGLEGREAEALVDRGKGEDGGAADHRFPAAVVEVPEPRDAWPMVGGRDGGGQVVLGPSL